MAATKRGRVQTQGTWPRCYFSSHVEAGGEKALAEEWQELRMPAYCLTARCSTWIHSASPSNQLHTNSSMGRSSRVQINIRCLSMQGLLLLLQTHWKLTTTITRRRGEKGRNPSLSGSAHTSGHRCIPKLQTTGISLEKAPTSPYCKKLL